MALQIHPPPGEVLDEIRAAILAALPGADVDVRGAAGHFEIAVTSDAFAGKSRLARQRLVYSAIAHLMKGDGAPVHAVDRMDTRTPDE